MMEEDKLDFMHMDREQHSSMPQFYGKKGPPKADKKKKATARKKFKARPLPAMYTQIRVAARAKK